jgi:hypothetical protein
MGSRILRRLQLGQESVAGTAVSATTIWGGPAEGIENTSKSVWVQQDIGRLTPGMRTYMPTIGAAYAMPETEATFQQLPHVLQAAFGKVTPTADGSGSDHIYTYALSGTSSIVPQTYTMEAGDDQQAYYMAYSFVPKFKLSGKLEQAVMVSADWVGRQRIKRAFTSSLSVPTNLKEILFGNGKLWIDDGGGVFGTTLKSNTLLGFEMDVETGLTPRFTADGNLYFSRTMQGVPKITAKITFEHDTTGVSEQDKWEAQAIRMVRLEWTGPALTTAGTTYSNQTFRIDMVGMWDSFAALGEDKGVDTVTGTLNVGDDGTHFVTFAVVNEDAAIP